MLKIGDLSVNDQRQMHQYRLKNGDTRIASFNEWRRAWKHYPNEFENAYNRWKNSMLNPIAAKLSSDDFLKACVSLQAAQVKCVSTTNIFGRVVDTTPCVPKICGIRAALEAKHPEYFGNEQKEKEETMDTRTEAQQAKDYLIKSLDQALWTKRAEAEETFNLHGQRPKTIKELREGLANGFVSVPEELDDKLAVYYWTDIVVYQDPSKKPDRKGYDEAVKQMTADASDVKDQIVVMGAEKGLEALNAFKAKTFH